MRTASLPAAFQQSAPATASLRCDTPALSGPAVRGVKDKLSVAYEKPTTGRVRARATHTAAAHAAGVHGLAEAAASSGGAGVLPDLKLFAAVTVVAAAAPTIIAAVKPWLSPIRCKECRGVTTTLCRVCCARGKVGGLFTGQLLQECENCEGMGRVTCRSCKGKGMVNSWLWQTNLSVPEPVEAIETPSTALTLDELLARTSIAGKDEQFFDQLLNAGSDEGWDEDDEQYLPYPRLEGKRSFRELVRDMKDSTDEDDW
mmetsp:Transcript_16038/g.48115  ORF Transcript_16038/g.48115 Transcript_16038/m.48115 type:complete len:258 (-) Transcript_16038:194-967(-)